MRSKGGSNARVTGGGGRVGTCLGLAAGAVMLTAVTGWMHRSITPSAATLPPDGNRAVQPLPPSPSVARVFARLPLAFEENRGQTDPQVRFYARGSRTAFFLAKDQAVLTFSEPTPAIAPAAFGTANGAARPSTRRGVALALEFVGSNPDVLVEGSGRATGVVNYFRGNDPDRWQTGLPRFDGVVYRNLWPGIDMHVADEAGAFKYEFHVRPGARPSDIRLAYDGASAVRLDASGSLRIDTPMGELCDAAPIAYQKIDGRRLAVESRYALEPRHDGESAYGFVVAGYQADRELVIDPGVAYSTLFGGSGDDPINDIGVDASGNAYVI